MNRGLRKHLKQLPYFLLFNYPEKQKTYEKVRDKNKKIENKNERYQLNAYHSPSPMNELCDYICAWEKKHILWNNTSLNLADIRQLIVNSELELSDRKIIRTVRRCINDYAAGIRSHIAADKERSDDEKNNFNRDAFIQKYKQLLSDELQFDEELTANYVISVSYSSLSISKAFAWAAYADYIIHNLKQRSPNSSHISITEVPEQSSTSYEYLGKYFEMEEASDNDKILL